MGGLYADSIVVGVDVGIEDGLSPGVGGCVGMSVGVSVGLGFLLVLGFGIGCPPVQAWQSTPE